MNRHDAHDVRAFYVALDGELERFDLMYESRERWRGVAVVIERERHEFVDGVASFGAEPREKGASSAVLAEQPAEEFKRSRLLRPIAPARDFLRGARMAAFGRCAQRCVERTGAVRRDFDQIGIVEADQRRFERTGERIIVLWRKRDARSGEEVHDRDMAGNFEPVGAGDGNALSLQCAHHGFEKRVAASHENHHVARPDWPQRPALRIMDAFARRRRDERPDFRGDALRELGRRRGFARQVERQRPFGRVGLLASRDRLPDFYHARNIVLERAMAWRRLLGIGVEAFARFGR